MANRGNYGASFKCLMLTGSAPCDDCIYIKVCQKGKACEDFQRYIVGNWKPSKSYDRNPTRAIYRRIFKGELTRGNYKARKTETSDID